MKKNEKEAFSSDIENLSYSSIEDRYTKYADSINIYISEKQNMPTFITEYYKEFDDTFKDIYYLHYPTPDSRRSSVYTKLFFKCSPEKLELIKTELTKSESLTNQDSLIIHTIDYVISNQD